MRVLLVEDETEFAKVVQRALERERYVVDHVEAVALALEAALLFPYDIALLDRNLPDGDGLSLVAALRASNPGIRIIVLTAKADLADRVTGLDEGADDYLVKPFALEELFARIRALRRRPSGLAEEKVEVGALVFDLLNEEACVGGVRLVLTRRELRVLATLVRRRGRTVLRESLQQSVYGFDEVMHSNTLDSHVSRLRRKLHEAKANVSIHTIKGVGYLLQAEL